MISIESFLLQTTDENFRNFEQVCGDGHLSTSHLRLWSLHQAFRTLSKETREVPHLVTPPLDF